MNLELPKFRRLCGEVSRKISLALGLGSNSSLYPIILLYFHNFEAKDVSSTPIETNRWPVSNLEFQVDFLRV